MAGLLTVLALAACGSNTEGTTGTSEPSPPPPPATRPASFGVGIETLTFVDHSRTTLDPLTNTQTPGRVLVTQIRYPTLAGAPGAESVDAKPASAYGPFPVVEFAHGYDTDPSVYAPLLDAWVRAGFVVVSPVFPDESSAAIARFGGRESNASLEAESKDVPNEPGDMAFVLHRFAALDEPPAGTFRSRLAGIADLSKVAVAGQSDGANVVAALGFGSAYASTWASISPRPRAVLVLSGSTLPDGPGGATNSYSSGPDSPDVLQVQSDADVCNVPVQALSLYNDLAGAPVHLFELLHGATHLEPYTNVVPGTNPFGPVVQRVTTDFLRLALQYQAAGLSVSSVIAAGSDSISKMLVSPDQVRAAIPGTVQPDVQGCFT